MHALVLACKAFYYRAISDLPWEIPHSLEWGGMGSRIHVHSLMQSPGSPHRTLLQKINILMHATNVTLDRMAIEAMLDEHTFNKRRLNERGAHLQRAVVVGAGPNGLMTAVRLFLAGFRVTLIERRMVYERSRFVFLNEKWVAQLKWLLGSRYNAVVGADMAHYVEWASTYILLLEGEVKSRLVELARLASERGEKKALRLVYGVGFEGVEFPREGDVTAFRAILSVEDGETDVVEVNGERRQTRRI